ncbi:RDD family protein [Flavobacterium sp. GSA192]|uniref:RDD family protein n=1 Tax=Flavobacterium sp. GSA192 TaxID=2576304 RepID=UPI00112A2E50|nr:RDD family protein [Flavobacterium sp. GSA192]
MTQNDLKLANQGQRILNAIIDMVTFLVIWFLLSIGLMLLELNQTYTDETHKQLPIIPIIILLPTFWGYYLLTEYKFQRTLGKVLTKTKVVSSSGDKPTLKQLIFRTLSRSIPLEYFSYIVTVKGIHDKLSSTRVIKN